MRKTIYIAAVASVGLLTFTTSCKKNYRCSCSFNNKIMYTRDLGTQSESKAQEICSSYDTSVTGEVWNCSVY